MSVEAGPRVLFVNDIAYIVETVTPSLSSLGVECNFVGRKAGNPETERLPFIVQTLESFLSMQDAPPHEILHINYGLFGFLALTEPLHPLVLHLHGSDIRPADSIKGRIANLLSRMAIELADDVWYSTPDLGPILLSRGLCGTFVPNPVSDGFFSNPPKYPDRPHVLFATPLSREKGADIAVNAMNVLVKKAPEIQISAFGFGTDPEEALAYREQIPKSINLLPWVAHDRVASMIAEASVVVGQLRYGILGNLELETMAAARPLLMRLNKSLYQGEPYYISDPPVISCETPRQVVGEVLRLVGNRSECESIGVASSKWTKQYHSARTVANLYRSRYLSLLRSTGE